MKMTNMHKKGLSAIIVTLLLIALVMAIFSMVFAFIVPFIKERMDESKTCFDALGKLGIEEGYSLTCYNESSGKTGISIKMGDVEIDGFKISLRGQEQSQVFEVKSGKVEGVKLYNGTDVLELPGKNEERTYIFNSSFEVKTALIAPVIGDKTCDEGSEAKIRKC